MKAILLDTETPTRATTFWIYKLSAGLLVKLILLCCFGCTIALIYANFSRSLGVKEAILIACALAFPLMLAQLIHRLRPRFGLLSLLLCILPLALGGIKLGMIIPDERFRIHNESCQFVFAILTIGVLSSLIGLRLCRFIIQKPNKIPTNSKQTTGSQFGIRRLVIWTTLIALTVGLISANDYFSISANSDPAHPFTFLINEVFFLGFLPFYCVVYMLGSILFFAPIQAWVRLAKPYFLSILTLVVFVFVTSISISYFLSDTPFAVRNQQYFVVILTTFSFAVIVASWTTAIQLFDGWTKTPIDDPFANPRFRLPGAKYLKRISFGFSILFALALIVWSVVHFRSRENQEVSGLVNSKAVREYLESHYEPDVVERVSRATESENLIDILNVLNGNGIAKEDNFAYQVAKLFKISSRNKEELLAIGLTAEEILSLEDHSLKEWLRKARPEFTDEKMEAKSQYWQIPSKDWSAIRIIRDFEKSGSNQDYKDAARDSYAWTKKDLPHAAEYCQANQELFQKLRNAADCSRLFMPLDPDGESPVGLVVEFASDLLSYDSNYQLGLGNLDIPIANIVALTSIADLMRPLPSRHLRSEQYLRLRSLIIAWKILDHPECSPIERERLYAWHKKQKQSLFLNSKKFAQQIAINHHDFGKEPEYNINYILGKTYIPEHSVNWEAFASQNIKGVQLGTDLIESTQSFTTNANSFNMQLEKQRNELFESLRFSHAVRAVALGPKQTGKLLSAWQNYDKLHSYSFLNLGVFEIQTEYLVQRLGFQLESYKHEHDQYPQSLDELDSSSILIDPFSNEPFVYKKTKDGFILYSVGRDYANNGNWTWQEDGITWWKPNSSLIEYLRDTYYVAGE